MTTEEKIKDLTWYNQPEKLKSVLTDINGDIPTASDVIAVIPASTNLPTVAGTFADLAAARTAVEAQRAGAEVRLDNLETKVNEIITKLKASGIIG